MLNANSEAPVFVNTSSHIHRRNLFILVTQRTCPPIFCERREGQILITFPWTSTSCDCRFSCYTP